MRKKRLLFTAIISLVIFLISSIGIWYNLTANSVYYAKHIPHKEGENPELVFIVDNLLFIQKDYTVHQYQLLSHTISTRQNAHLEYSYIDPKDYMLFMTNKGKYIWNEQGKFLYYTAYGQADHRLTDRHYQAAAENELHAIIDPIIELQEEPILNLQWLFNWVHRERFNK